MRFIFEKIKQLSLELLIILILLVISITGLAWLTNEVFHIGDTEFDKEVFHCILPFINEQNTSAMVWASFFASQTFLLPANIAVVLYFMFIAKHRGYSIKIPVVALGSFALMSGLKLFFQRPRPHNPVFEAALGFSYPSGHAMSAMTFYGLLVFIIWERIENVYFRWAFTILMAAIVAIIGFSRVYLRVHYASDVLAGFSAVLIWLVLSLWILGKFEK